LELFSNIFDCVSWKSRKSDRTVLFVKMERELVRGCERTKDGLKNAGMCESPCRLKLQTYPISSVRHVGV